MRDTNTKSWSGSFQRQRDVVPCLQQRHRTVKGEGRERTYLSSALSNGRLVDKRDGLLLGLHVDSNVIASVPTSTVNSFCQRQLCTANSREKRHSP